MKKLICLALCVMLCMLSVPAMGAGVASGALTGLVSTATKEPEQDRVAAVAEGVLPPEEFTIRGSVTWNSTKEEILQMGEVELEESWQSSVLVGEGLPVSRYDAAVAYIFQQDKLVAVAYGIDSVSMDDENYLTEALASKYGMPTDSDMERVNRLLVPIIDEGIEETVNLTCWTLEDGTLISLFSARAYSGDGSGKDRSVFIFYFNEPVLMELGGIYNTDGI